MATELSTLAQTKTDEVQQKIQLVLEIDGVPTRYSLGTIRKYVRIGDPGLEIGNDWRIGGFIDQDNQLDAITLDGTSTTIAQQLLQDRGGTSSVSGISVSLLDIDEQITRLITPGEVVDDILGRKAYVYLGYQDTAFPQDFTQIFAGVIDEVIAGPTIVLNIAHPEQKKRGQVLTKVSTALTQALKFRSEVIQGILYKTRRDVSGTVTIIYTDTVASGFEEVNVVGTTITVQIEAGVTTANDVRDVIEKSIDALSLVEIQLVSGMGPLLQIAQSATPLNSDTTIVVEDTKGFVLPAASEGLRTYVRINDEIIEYTGFTDTTFIGCTRQAFFDLDARAFGAHHEDEDTVESFYRIQGSAIDICLKMLLSGGPAYFAENVDISSINVVEVLEYFPNAVYFEGINVSDKYGVVIGDMVSITGDSDPANNVTDAEVIEVVVTEFGSYIVLDSVMLVDQVNTPAVIAFKTKWNVWPAEAGLGMGGDEIDVPQFEYIKETFSTSIFEYDFYITETVEVKDFLDTEVLFPTGAFTLPRKGKISLGFTAPPLSIQNLVTLNASNTIKPEQNKVYRSLSKYFYNNVVFKYNEDVLDAGKYLSGDLTVDADSKSRIRASNKTFVVSARGLRPSVDTDSIMTILIGRFLDRYKFAAERIKIQGFYGKTFNNDVGDIVPFGGIELKIPSSDNASRRTPVKLYEIVNKSLGITSGITTLDLVDTAYSIEGARYGVVSPASYIAAGSTTSELKLKNSFGNLAPKKEKVKYTDFYGEQVLIHDSDWTYQYERTLVSFKTSDGNVMLINPPLPAPPSEDDIVEIIHYPDNDNNEDAALYKSRFVFTNPSVPVVSGVNGTSFNVSLSDADLFKPGQPILLHKEDTDGIWTNYSPEVLIDSVVGTLITVDEDMGLTPDNTYTVELIGYPDEGAPYRYL